MMTKEETLAMIAERERALAVVRKVLIERLHVPRAPEEIDPDAPLFGTGLGLDSVDAVELVVSLERELGVAFPDEAVGKRALRTVGTLVDLVLARAPEPREVCPLDPETRAVREGVALERPRGLFARVSGGDVAWETLSAVSACDLFLRDGQAIHTLWLDGSGHPLADVYVARSDADFFVFAEGDGALEHLRRNAHPGTVIDDLGPSHRWLALHGPFAWELLGEIVGREVIGAPYLSLFRVGDGGLGLRAGRTGEFGYELLLPEPADAIERALLDAGARFDLRRVDRSVVARCMIENGFFDIQRAALRELTPAELQLQWRASSTKDYVGKQPARADRRVITLLTDGSKPVGARVEIFGEIVGRVVASERSVARGEWIALALVDAPWCAPHIDAFTIDGARARSVTPPLIDNQSLYVNPQNHSYATRADARFPPLVRA